MKINRQQALELLKSLEEFGDAPRAGLDLAATISANAQRAQIEAEKRFSLTLTSDEAGVKALSELISALHQGMLPNRLAQIVGAKISFQSSVLVANTFGAFLGEALRNRVGGEWKLVDHGAQTLVALYRGEGNFSLPTYKAGKHFQNGCEDDVWGFYCAMVLRLGGNSVKPILTISTDDLKNPAELSRKWAEAFKNPRPARN
jgi:hypothetical protein